ncbi:MAG TPA: Gfo/Idh/MocA family oxidoreductase [Tepidisphaeraceae bacterium]|nr:Gfo/Idh/MocA family oxidoreductase [Tepidisphaeraceae bacterium]
MAKTWRCAVVGTGVVGEWHVRIIPHVPNAQLVAVCDIDPAKAQAALDKNKLTGVPVYASQREMLDKEQIDVVHVCTPSGDHMGPAVMAMESGRNVIVEKPVEIQLDRIDRMVATAAKHNVKLAGIFQNRWNDANRAIKDAADEGRFGRVAWAGCFTPWYRTDAYYRDGGWRGTWALDGGGAIMNQSVHAVDMLQWIAGPVRTVSAYASSRVHAEIEVEDTLTCALQFASGAFGTIMGSTAMYPGGGVRYEVGGEHGTAVADGGLKRFAFRDERPGDKELLAGTKPATTGGGASATDVSLDLHGHNIQHILSAWAEGKEAETNGVEASKAVAIILAMYESARKGGVPVEVK